MAHAAICIFLTAFLVCYESSIIKAQDDSIETPNYLSDEPFALKTADDSNADLQKRLSSSFVRIGRGLSSFIRIGKSTPTMEDNPYDGFTPEKRRTSSFVRIGKDVPYFLPGDIGDGLADENEPTQQMNGLEKRPSAFVRIGKNYDPEAAKRYSSFVRIGRNGPEQKRPSSFVRIGKDGEMNKRYSSFVRIGRGMEGMVDKSPQRRGSAFIRVGKFPSMSFLNSRDSLLKTLMKQPYFRRTGRIGHSSFIRIGKRDTSRALQLRLEQEDLDRINRFLRIGKELEEELYGNAVEDPNAETGKKIRDTEPVQPAAAAQKRYSSFVRIGKNYENDAGKGKNMADELITEKDIPKRYSSFVRIGKNGPSIQNKRPINYVKTETSDGSNNPDKRYRASSFVRIGKKSKETLEPEKRYSSFVRIGKKDSAPNAQLYADKRYSSSFVRIGKKDVKPKYLLAEVQEPMQKPSQQADPESKSAAS